MHRFILLVCTTVTVSFLQVLFAQESNDRISKLSELGPEIQEMMQTHKLSGVSIAILEDDKIIWNGVYGVKENGTEQEITKETAFSTASISKAVTATVSLLLQEQGKIDIDQPVSKYLKRWKLPNSPFLEKTDLTIRHLLSHSGGASHSGYADFYGEDKIPTIVEVLNGEGLPNYEEGVVIQFEPGTKASYSGGGYVITQLAIEDTLGRPFQDIVQEMIFDPLQMQNSTMLQPNQKDFPADVAKVHDAAQNVIRTGLPICPQLGPSGMWSSAEDLAKFALETQKALNNKETKVISPNVAKALTQIVSYSYAGGGALGWQRSFSYGNLEWVTIGGSNAGVGGEVNISYKGGKGIVLLANGETKNRLPVFSLIRSEVINQLDWGQELKETHPLDDEGFISAIQGSYLDFMFGDFSEIVTITENNGRLSIASPILKLLTGSTSNRLYHQGNYIFKITDYPNAIQFNYNGVTVDTVSVYRDGEALEKWTIPIDSLKTIRVKLMEIFTEADFKIAKQHYHTLLANTANYDFSNSLLQLGVSFFSRGETHRALQLFEFNAEQHPVNPDSHLALAEVHERLGSLKKAIIHYQDALAITEDEKTKSAISTKIKILDNN